MARRNSKNSLKNEQYYTRLIVYRARLYALIMIIGVATVGLSYVVFENSLNNNSWTVLILPMIALAVAFCLFPETEEWEYKHWQSSPQQYERHFRD